MDGQERMAPLSKFRCQNHTLVGRPAHNDDYDNNNTGSKNGSSAGREVVYGHQDPTRLAQQLRRGGETEEVEVRVAGW